MAQIWKERLNVEKHADFMTGHQDPGGRPVEAPRDNLLESWVYFMKTPDCELQFTLREQVEEAKRYFEEKIHPARREWSNGLEHYWQRWFERLPAGVHRDPNRIRILVALERLLEAIDSGSLEERG